MIQIWNKLKTERIITVEHAAESYGLQLSDASEIVRNDAGMRKIEYNWSISHWDLICQLIHNTIHGLHSHKSSAVLKQNRRR